MSKAFEVTDSSFESDVVGAETPVVVDFWAVWCGPCRMVAPIVDELATEYDGKVGFAKLNVDENPEVSMKYGIRSIPTLLVFKDGKPVDQIVGALPRRRCRSAWRRRSPSPAPRERMGPGGLRGLQTRWRAPFGVRGGFDSHPFPPRALALAGVFAEDDAPA